MNWINETHGPGTLSRARKVAKILTEWGYPTRVTTKEAPFPSGLSRDLISQAVLQVAAGFTAHHGNAGNQNARKSDKDRKSARLHILCRPGEKTAWAHRAKLNDQDLAEWVRQTLNEKSGRTTY